ncbi:Vacuolar ATP synthase subunit B [Mycena sanguinolenta]|uniref:Vacuolar ATP synthase subunit B n=1 Tax=Mycena sanguinolenta TaxID=230812 RepID=A0A8H6XTQ9_9AGAR|nr:Vacuolar ATP synthase subunit B [Mycena sanguinolenta]
MDDIAHECPRNHRKRKAAPDDPQDPGAADAGDAILPDPVVVSPSGPPLWLFVRPKKRPRFQKRDSGVGSNNYGPSARRIGKRSCMRPPRSPPHPRLGNDLEDIGIVSTSDPGPSSGSLLRLRDTVFTKSAISPIPMIDLNSAHIPPAHPPINRNTLKELDLDVIIRNPQLRHDLLFDPGLQFRPTNARRKTERAEKYWAAITTELETGCTCVSFDMGSKPHPTVCACAHVSPSLNPVRAFPPTLHVVTLRMPSRIRALLDEFLEVLLLVIQPLSNIAGAHVSPTMSQQAEHVAQAAYIRSVFDPALIEQELKHNLFDPSGLFRAIGVTLQGHCAPMRDHDVELMVQVAQTCAPGGKGTKADAVRAVRMCMDILELMKLDIANHQLQTLRPFLMRTSGQFELPQAQGRGTLPTVSSPPEYPETSYLDNARILQLSTEAVDLTALYMFLLLYRQLKLSSSESSTSGSVPEEWELAKIKREIRDIGSSRLGYAFYCGSNASSSDAATMEGVDTEELEKRRALKQNVVLQIAMRAKNSTTNDTASPSVDASLLLVAQRWADTNIQQDSALSGLLSKRLRDVVFNAVVGLAYPGRDATRPSVDFSTFRLSRIPGSPSSPSCASANVNVAGTGMEVLAEEIGLLAENISKLALIHLNTYLPLYEVEHFLD